MSSHPERYFLSGFIISTKSDPKKLPPELVVVYCPSIVASTILPAKSLTTWLDWISFRSKVAKKF